MNLAEPIERLADVLENVGRNDQVEGAIVIGGTRKVLAD